MGETGYETLTVAFEAATDGRTVVLVKDTEPAEAIVVTGKVTLDLNGCTVAATMESKGKAFIVEQTGSLTIRDSGKDGKITFTVPADKGRPNNDLIRVTGNFTLEGGMLETNDGCTVRIDGDGLSTTPQGIINGGTVSNICLYNNVGIAINVVNKGSLTVNVGRVEQTTCGESVIFGDQAVKITGGVITGNAYHTILAYGPFTMSGGRIEQTSDKEVNRYWYNPVTAIYNGQGSSPMIITGGGIVSSKMAFSYTGINSPGEVQISNAKISAGNALFFSNNNRAVVKARISSGEIIVPKLVKNEGKSATVLTGLCMCQEPR